MPTFNWVSENQPIASEKLTRYKSAESNLLADNKGPKHLDPGSCLVIHLYLYIFIIYISKSFDDLNC